MSLTKKSPPRVYVSAPLGRAAIVSALMASTALVALTSQAAHADSLVIFEGQDTIIGPVDGSGPGPGTVASGQVFDSVILGGTEDVKGIGLTVSGNGTLTSRLAIVVGDRDGTSATLTIEGGGDVAGDGSLFIGNGSASAGVVTVSGEGSSLSLGGAIFVGSDFYAQEGSSATLAVNGGGTVTAAYLEVGSVYGGDEKLGRVTVSGSGSTITLNGKIGIGEYGRGELQVYDAGLVEAVEIRLGIAAGSSGAITVSGENSRLVADKAIIVGDGGSGTLNVAAGGDVTGQDLIIGSNAGLTGEVTVSGDGTTLTVNESIDVGLEGAGLLNIDSGAAVQANGALSIGSILGSESAVVVSGAGSNLRVAERLTLGGVGEGASAGTLTITDGGTVSANSVDLEGGGDFVSQVAVTGANSTLDVNAKITVGGLGEGRVDILNGGAVSAYAVDLGAEAGSNGLVTVSGNADENSRLSVDEGIAVGIGGEGTLRIEAGGAVASTIFLTMGRSAGSTGVVTVSGADSTLTLGGGGYLGEIVVGQSGEGRLDILDGGAASSSFMTLGELQGSSGVVTVSGANSILSLGVVVVVGQDGNGVLTISRGGVVQADRLTMAQYEGSNGTINIGATQGAVATSAGRLQSNGGSATSIEFGDRPDGEFVEQGTGTIVFNHTETDYVFDANVSGQGMLRQLAGKTRLTGDFTGFTGSAELLGGKLALDTTTFNHAVAVSSGATLTGTGSVGNVDFAAGAIYEADVNASQFLTSTGTIFIDPAATVSLVANRTDQVRLDSPITILSATNGVTGTFGTLIEDLAFLDATLGYDGNSIALTLTRNNSGFVEVAQTPNQIASASGLASMEPGSPLDTAIFALSADQARAAFDALSGDMHASLQGVLLSDSSFTRDIVTKRMATSVDARQPGAGPSSWAQGYGAWGELATDGNAAGISRATGGLLFGADADLASGWNAGLIAGYGSTNTAVDARAAHADVDSFTLGGYGSSQVGNVKVKLGAAYSLHSVSSTRDVAFGDLSDQLTAPYLAGTGQVFGQIGYAIDTPNGHIEPFAGLAVIRQDSAGFTENGGPAALAADAASQVLGVSTLGLRSSYTLATTEDVMVDLSGALGWRHAIGDLAPQVQASFAGSTGFTVAGAPVDRDSVVVELGLNAAFGGGSRAGLNYRGEIGQSVQNHGLFFSVARAY